MTKEEAYYLLDVINNWILKNKYTSNNPYGNGLEIFTLLPEYKKEFPNDCFYTGEIKRKMPEQECPLILQACSKLEGDNSGIGTGDLLLKIMGRAVPQKYQYFSDTTNGFDLEKIINYLILTFKLSNKSTEALNKVSREKEVICYMNPQNYVKEKAEYNIQFFSI